MKTRYQVYYFNLDIRNNKYCSTMNVMVPCWAETPFDTEDQAKRAIGREGNVSLNYYVLPVYSID